MTVGARLEHKTETKTTPNTSGTYSEFSYTLPKNGYFYLMFYLPGYDTSNVTFKIGDETILNGAPSSAYTMDVYYGKAGQTVYLKVARQNTTSIVSIAYQI